MFGNVYFILVGASLKQWMEALQESNFGFSMHSEGGLSLLKLFCFLFISDLQSEITYTIFKHQTFLIMYL